MLTRILRYVKGYVRIRIRGNSPERFLNLCRYHHIPVWGLEPKGHAYEMYVTIHGVKHLGPILRKTNTRMRILKKYGLPFFLFQHRKRKVFFAGCLGCLALIYVLSLFVWDIQIEGNYKKTDETLLAFLRKEKIACGMRRSEVDCPEIAKMIRKEFEDVIWVSASLEGCRIRIAIKENSDSGEEAEQGAEEKKTGENSEEGTDLIAEKDGVVRKIVVRNGIPQVHEGDQVKKGDLFVSGKVEIKNDSQEITGWQYQHSDADIWMETEQEYEDILNLSYKEKRYEKREKHQIYWKTGKKEYALGSEMKAGKQVEIHSSEVRIGLSKSFQFPISVGIRTMRTYKNIGKTYTQEEFQKILSERFALFQRDLRKKGVQILENNVKIYKDKDNAYARGTLTLLEKCGKERKTEHGNVREND